VLRAPIHNEADFERVYGEAAPRRAVETLLSEDSRNLVEWHYCGWCDVCEQASRFLCDWQYTVEEVPNFRERLVCAICHLNARQRLAISLLRETLETLSPNRSAPSIYVYEQVTPLYREIVNRFPRATVTGSEYLGHDMVPGTYADGIRHEDALALSFEDGCFDVVLSNDVYEHVPDIEPALSEAARVLRDGGLLIATVPFTFQNETRRRAELKDGRIQHLDEPQFHGNPMSESGSLVFYDFGWDLLEICRRAGFSDAHFLCTHSFFRAYLGPTLGLTLMGTRRR
jgi:SAM-dependent methyltransferase